MPDTYRSCCFSSVGSLWNTMLHYCRESNAELNGWIEINFIIFWENFLECDNKFRRWIQL